MKARCAIDSPIWGVNGMNDEQVASYYQVKDHCEKNVKNFSKMNYCEQAAEIVMQMHRYTSKGIKPEQMFFELVEGIDNLFRIESEQKALFAEMRKAEKNNISVLRDDGSMRIYDKEYR